MQIFKGGSSTVTSTSHQQVYLELALDGRVFHQLPSLLLTAPAVAKEEFYQRRLHAVLTDFLTLMPLRVKELRNRADDCARTALMHEQEGIQYSVPLVGQHWSQVLATLSALYAGDKLGLGLAELFWCSTESGQDYRHCSAKQVSCLDIPMQSLV